MLASIWNTFSGDFLGHDLLESWTFFWPRLFCSLFCGFIIGAERQIKGRPAGIRTAVLVCVGSALFTGTALLLSSDMRATGLKEGFAMPVVGDPGRIISQIVSGVGFIGAGLIFKFQDRVAGITTAALIWTVCAIGIVVGLGGYLISLIITVVLVTALVLIEILERNTFLRPPNKFKDTSLNHPPVTTLQEHQENSLTGER